MNAISFVYIQMAWPLLAKTLCFNILTLMEAKFQSWVILILLKPKWQIAQCLNVISEAMMRALREPYVSWAILGLLVLYLDLFQGTVNRK